MNNKFFQLPKERQQKIINAAYKIFSKTSYKKLLCQKLRMNVKYQKLSYSTTF